MLGEKSTTDEVLQGVDLTGKRFLVTGVSAGLGVETARALVAHGAEVVGTVRNREKAATSTTVIRDAAQAHGGRFDLVDMDLASLKSVRACADALLRDGRLLDVVIANAGVMTTPYGKTEDGFETQFGTNHLGHFTFINRIASLIRPGGRVVMLASSGHRFSDIDLDDPNFEKKPYDTFAAYGYAKTANILFAVEFDRRHKEKGIRATALHPGGIQTELGRHATEETRSHIQQMVEKIAERARAKGEEAFIYKSIPQGAATTVWAATVAPAKEIGGNYCMDCRVVEVNDDPEEMRDGVRSWAIDPARAKMLWEISEKLVGEYFP